MAYFPDEDNQVEGDNTELETVFSRFVGNLVELHNDTRTTDPIQLAEFYLTHDFATTISESIGVGLTINKTTSPPSIHMANIPFSEMRESAPLLKEELIDKVTKYERIAARTPSVEAMRAMLLLLAEISNDKQTKRDIFILIKDIKKLDLTNSSQDEWSRKITIKVDDISFDIDINLEKFGITGRAASKAIPTQLSAQSKHNKHQFKLDIRANKQKKSTMLKFLEQKSEKIIGFAFGSVFTGTCIMGGYAGMLGVELFSRTTIQSNVIGQFLSDYGDYGSLGLGICSSVVLLDPKKSS